MERYVINFCQGNIRHWMYTNQIETAQILFDTYKAVDKYIEVYDNKAKKFVHTALDPKLIAYN